MKTTVLLGVAAVLGAMAAAGCASHNAMQPPALWVQAYGVVTEEQARQLEAKITDRDIADVLDANVKPKLPTRLAVARIDLRWDSGSYRSYYGGPELTSIAGEESREWERSLTGLDGIQGLRTVSRLPGQDGNVTMHLLRSSAAQMGCELLLVYVVGQSEVSNYNHAAMLYWTVVGLFVVPGSEFQHRTVMQAILVDTRTGVILGTAGGEASAKEVYIPVAKGIVHDRLSARTPPEALSALQKNTADMVRQVVGG